MRIYVLIALLIGALIYFQLVADRIKTSLEKLAQAILWLIRSIVVGIKRPVVKAFIFIKAKLKKPDLPPPDDVNE
jgi:hypothetical protein